MLGARQDGTADTSFSTTQTGLIADSPTGQITTVLIPKLKHQPELEVDTLADGNAVRVRSQTSTDYIFLSPGSFRFEDQDIEFEGTSGLIRLQGNNVTLTLGAGGGITGKGRRLESEQPTSKTWNSKP